MSVKGSSKIWTPKAVATLRRLFPDTPSQDIADEIGCSDSTVLYKARELGLKRNPDYHRNNFIGRYTRRGRYRKENN